MIQYDVQSTYNQHHIYMNLLASIRGGFGTTCVSIVELPNNSTIGNDGSAGREASLPSHDRQRSSLTLAWYCPKSLSKTCCVNIWLRFLVSQASMVYSRPQLKITKQVWVSDSFHWWLKSCTSWLVSYPVIIEKVWTIPTGAGVQLSNSLTSRRKGALDTTSSLSCPVIVSGWWTVWWSACQCP